MPKATPLSLEELNILMQRLEVTLQWLVGGSDGSRPARAVGGGDGRRGPRRDRAAAQQLQAKLLATLAGAKNGLSLGELAAKVGGSKEAVGYHLRVLRDSKRARVAGTRGTARWHAA